MAPVLWTYGCPGLWGTWVATEWLGTISSAQLRCSGSIAVYRGLGVYGFRVSGFSLGFRGLEFMGFGGFYAAATLNPITR